MRFELTDDQAKALSDVLAAVLGDLSYEIAATENPHFRQSLLTKRDRLTEVARELSRGQ